MTARRPSIRLIDAELARPTATSHETHILNRSTEMQLMHEAMARAKCQDRHESLSAELRVARLRALQRRARRAEQAGMRVRRLMAVAVLR
jgi:hypothetical protein